MNWKLLALIGCFALLATIYSLTTPLFEAPDEMDHFRYVNWLATGQGLPNLADDLAQAGHEIGQPPLYYGLLAAIVWPVDMSDLFEVAPANPYWREGVGVNLHYHTQAEQFPWRDTALAVRLARFVSILLGIITVTATYHIARLIMPGFALLAAAFVVFNPMFVFMSGVVNNDNLIVALSTLTLWLLVRNLLLPSTAVWSYALVGIVWGLAILSKMSGAALGGVILVGLAFTAYRRRSWKTLFYGSLWAGVGAALVAGWWFVRNSLLYGDPLAWDLFLRANQGVIRPSLLSWPQAVSRFYPLVPRTFWASFNYGNFAPESFYIFINGVMLLAVAGLTVWFIRYGVKQLTASRTLAVILLAIWCLLVFISLAQWIRQVEQTEQGRLVFPALGSMAVLLALGLITLFRRQRWVLTGIVAILAVWTAVMPFIVIQPAYAQPKPLASEAVIPTPLNVQFGDEIQLLGYDFPETAVSPGESFFVTLYWEGLKPMSENYAIALHVVDAAGEVAASLDTIPYQGRYATAVWPPRQPFPDQYDLSLNPQAAPGLAAIWLTVYPWRQTERALPVTVDGLDVGNSLQLAQFKIKPGDNLRYTPSNPLDAAFGQAARLTGYEWSADTANLTLYWEAVEPNGRDYTVLVHILDESGELAAQADSPPQNNKYPTSIWAAGEQIRDLHPLDLSQLSPDQYTILVGLYDRETGQRLPAFTADGRRLPDDRLEITVINVER